MLEIVFGIWLFGLLLSVFFVIKKGCGIVQMIAKLWEYRKNKRAFFLNEEVFNSFLQP